MAEDKRAYYERLSKSDLVELLLRKDREMSKWLTISGEPVTDLKELLRGPHNSVVYLLKWGDRYKIGRSRNVSNRIRSLSFPLDTLVGALWGGSDLESDLHRKFSEFRIGKTEWFVPSPNIDWVFQLGSEEVEDSEPPKNELLEDIREILMNGPDKGVFSEELRLALNPKWNLSKKEIARKLALVGIQPTKFRRGDIQNRGYLRRDFEKVWG